MNLYASICQNGRSMIEMLGVLAVVGVLSVGGIAGYSKAMDKYKVNKTLNQISYIVSNTRTLFGSQPDLYGSMSFDYETVMSNTTYTNRLLSDKAKIFPEELIKNNYKNIFGGDILFFADGRFTENDGKAFILQFRNIPQEACIEIATQDWQASLGVIAMRIRGSSNGDTSNFIRNAYIGTCISDYQTGAGRICASDMPMSVDKAVLTCNSPENNVISWKFY